MSGVFRTLISVDDLIAHYDTAHWCIVDCRHALNDVEYGRAAYAAGHLPGAIFMHLDAHLSGPMTGCNGRHPLPDPSVFALRLGDAGIGNDTQVIAYDDAGGVYASRLWTLLRWLGHDKVAVLDGGIRAWCEADQALEQDPPTRAAQPFTPSLQPVMVSLATVEAHLGQPDLLIVDARSPDRFQGENETLDPVGGHIPGAINRFFRNNLASDRFKSPEQLRADFLGLIDGRPLTTVVHQCGSGVTACHNLLAMEHAGLSGTRLYAGSWSEWCADPGRPIATGSER